MAELEAAEAEQELDEIYKNTDDPETKSAIQTVRESINNPDIEGREVDELLTRQLSAVAEQAKQAEAQSLSPEVRGPPPKGPMISTLKSLLKYLVGVNVLYRGGMHIKNVLKVLKILMGAAKSIITYNTALPAAAGTAGTAGTAAGTAGTAGTAAGTAAAGTAVTSQSSFVFSLYGALSSLSITGQVAIGVVASLLGVTSYSVFNALKEAYARRSKKFIVDIEAGQMNIRKDAAALALSEIAAAAENETKTAAIIQDNILRPLYMAKTQLELHNMGKFFSNVTTAVNNVFELMGSVNKAGELLVTVVNLPGNIGDQVLTLPGDMYKIYQLSEQIKDTDDEEEEKELLSKFTEQLESLEPKIAMASTFMPAYMLTTAPLGGLAAAAVGRKVTYRTLPLVAALGDVAKSKIYELDKKKLDEFKKGIINLNDVAGKARYLEKSKQRKKAINSVKKLTTGMGEAVAEAVGIKPNGNEDEDEEMAGDENGNEDEEMAGDENGNEDEDEDEEVLMKKRDENEDEEVVMAGDENKAMNMVVEGYGSGAVDEEGGDVGGGKYKKRRTKSRRILRKKSTKRRKSTRRNPRKSTKRKSRKTTVRRKSKKLSRKSKRLSRKLKK